MDYKEIDKLIKEADIGIEKEWNEISSDKLPELPTASLTVRDVKPEQYVFVRYEFMVKGGFKTEMPCGINDGQVKITVIEPNDSTEISIESGRKAIEGQRWKEVKNIKNRSEFRMKEEELTFIEELERL